VKFHACLLVLACLGGALAAQDSRAKTPDAPYLIPQTIFVGDTGRLVVPLGPVALGPGPRILDAFPGSSPGGPVILRAEVENQGQEARLLVDFKAFTPGILRLPPIEIAGLGFSDLEVSIASILETGEGPLILSPPASPLAAPGTLALIYGGVLGLALFVLGLAGMGLWGIPGLRQYRERFRRRRRIRVMEKSWGLLLAKLRREGGEEEALSRLSGEFRDFLAFFTRMNCRAMAAGEFLHIPPLSEEYGPPLTGPFLQGLFRRWDALRFRGAGISREAALAIFEEVRRFTKALDQAEGVRPGAGPAMSPALPEAGS
jgi:hypothetical protein